MKYYEEPKKQDRTIVDGTIIEVGMPLVDKAGNLIGKVKEIQEKGFIVDRSAFHFDDLFVPYWICLEDGPGQIRADISDKEVNTNVWRTSNRQH